MTKISETDYLNMSINDLYKEYCRIYDEYCRIYIAYEELVKQEIERLETEINKEKVELQLSHIQKPISSGDFLKHYFSEENEE